MKKLNSDKFWDVFQSLNKKIPDVDDIYFNEEIRFCKKFPFIEKRMVQYKYTKFETPLYQPFNIDKWKNVDYFWIETTLKIHMSKKKFEQFIVNNKKN